MSMKSPPLVAASVVVKRETKQAALKEFIGRHLATLAHADIGCGMAARKPERRTFTVVARSSESPVAQVLMSLAVELAAAGVVVRAIFAQLSAANDPEGWIMPGQGLSFDRELRQARNVRLIDAHEQLVLGPATAWIGDSMRRDPAKRDAFELFADDCADTAMFGRVSFERLWAVSEPVKVTKGPVGMTAGLDSLDNAEDDMPPPGEPGAAGADPVASTRH
jgi:hypothetical protein